jgi:hypothetical protein
MKRICTLVLLLLHAGFIEAQIVRPFAESQGQQKVSDEKIRKFRSYSYDKSAFDQLHIPRLEEIGSIQKSKAELELPLADGRRLPIRIAEIRVLSPASAALYPEIRTYDVLSADGLISGRLTRSPMGINCLLLTPEGRQYLAPSNPGDAVRHVVYHKRDYDATSIEVKCGVQDVEDVVKELKLKTTAPLGDCLLRTYNFAVAATGEFTTLLGSQINAIASITATVANVNLIYERDLGIHFNLVINNSIVFTNATSDPYPTVTSPTQTVLDTNTAVLNATLGPSGYDLGIVFNNAWNGGLAYNPGVCNNSVKGGAAAGVSGSPFGYVMETIVAHEVGHLFDADHTMASGTGAGCSGNLNLPTAYEIGGGSTIMAYAGAVCPGMSYQANTDDYFHFNSVAVIRLYSQALTTCGVTSNQGNTAPTLTVPAPAYTIPVSTPFELTASGSDPNTNNVLTYTFEQYDAATSAMTAPPSPTTTTGPLFRSYPPSTSNTRTFPALPYILNNTTSSWEVLPSVTRTLNFRALVRDNNPGDGCVAQESITVNTNSTAGPFAITSQNTTGSFTANGVNTMVVTWNVANTNASPVNASAVNIYFSSDNGQSFPYLLASNVSNTGTATVIVPNVNTTQGRIKVKAANNIFFDINNAPLTINSTCTANGSTISPAASITAPQGSASLNLSLSPNYGTPLTISGSLTSTDPVSSLGAVNVSGSNCINFSGNQFQYDLYTFQVNVPGTYTFTTSASTPFGTVINLYENSFSTTSPCANFITSSAVYNGTSATLGNSISASLNPGITYVLAVGTFSNTQPTLPASYSVNVTAPAGGNIYSGTPNPGAAYAYMYVIVNNATGNIVGISATPNLSTYPAGSYSVYGLSVNNAVSLPTLNAYVGLSFSLLQAALLNSTLCGNLSGNSVSVTITAPLRLSKLELQAVASGEDARLNWRAVGEEQVQTYEVERSANGADFEVLGSVTGTRAGTYTFYDKHPIAGANYYRVRATEVGGGSLLSNTAWVQFRAFGSGIALVLPNPTNGLSTVRLPKEASYECVLTDISGQVVHSFRAEGAEFTIDLSRFASGTYMLRCTSGDEHIVSRIVKQ